MSEKRTKAMESQNRHGIRPCFHAFMVYVSACGKLTFSTVPLLGERKFNIREKKGKKYIHKCIYLYTYTHLLRTPTRLIYACFNISAKLKRNVNWSSECKQYWRLIKCRFVGEPKCCLHSFGSRNINSFIFNFTMYLNWSFLIILAYIIGWKT